MSGSFFKCGENPFVFFVRDIFLSRKETISTMSESKNGEKKVKINDDRGNVVEVSEKHGPLFNAIPKMHLCGAAILCLLNIAIPGLGTIISAFTVFCGCPTKIEKRMNAFLLNILAGFLQMVTFIIIVGWIWSILWGMNFVQLAIAKGEEQEAEFQNLGGPYYVRRQSSVDVPLA